MGQRIFFFLTAVLSEERQSWWEDIGIEDGGHGKRRGCGQRFVIVLSIDEEKSVTRACRSGEYALVERKIRTAT
jgi:hypothetical protein